ncbi:hypothetical protein [Streptomyces sp. ISL-98]|nr:hypothetical protein [Streptomyces sp. ISL-98]
MRRVGLRPRESVTAQRTGSLPLIAMSALNASANLGQFGDPVAEL